MEMVVLNKWNNEMRVDLKRKNTAVNYNSGIIDFMNYVNIDAENDREVIEIVDRDIIVGYKTHLFDNGKKLSTINARLSALKGYFEFAKKENIINSNPVDDVDIYNRKQIDKNTKKKEILTEKELKKIFVNSYVRIKGEKKFEFSSARDRFLLAIMTETGGRISEYLESKLCDLEEINNKLSDNEIKKVKLLENMTIENGCTESECNNALALINSIKNKSKEGYMLVINGDRVKNSLDKRFPVTGKVLKYYNEYMDIREELGIKSDYLIVSDSGNPLAGKDVNKIIKKACKKAEIDKHITNHSFRYIADMLMKKHGVDKDIINDILGWVGKGYDMQNHYGMYYDKSNDDRKIIKACSFIDNILV